MLNEKLHDELSVFLKENYHEFVDCTLYDSLAGGGGCWGIELEKDIELPIKFIHKAVPDGCLDYSMKECYGVTSDCWKDALKEIKD